MKKQILLLALSALSFGAFAQSKVEITARGGFASSSMRGDAVNSLKNLLDYANGAITTANRNAFFAGASASIPLSPLMSVEPGLYYTQKGYELNGELNIKGAEFLGIKGKSMLTTHYVDLPVVLKANLNGLELFAGPQISYMAAADLKTTAGVLGFNVVNSSLDATSQFNRWDAGVTGGIGYTFPGGVNLRASYDRGLSKVDANKNLESYNQSFRVGIGYRF